MTRLEKNLLKNTIVRYNRWIIGFGIMAIIEAILSFYLIISNPIVYKTTATIGILTAIILLLISSIISSMCIKLDVKLKQYLKEINNKRDDHYYNMACLYSKRNNFEKATFFRNLMKDKNKGYAISGFILNDMVSKNNNLGLNIVLEKLNQNMKKYGM